MLARVPQDVDLEDRLVYGLTPVRFGYLVIAALGALSLWRVEPAPAWLRAVVCALLLASGSALAWGRWRGRAFDAWLADLAVYVRRNHRLGLVRGRQTREPVPLRAISALAAPAAGEGTAP